ncbi:hypothetical protein [Streptomyces lavendulocolor]|uniref:hypothetical protein n=1 Tax=Streptomyces lavendulocolor TaxID=67316 RepID=UPI0033C8CCDC
MQLVATAGFLVTSLGVFMLGAANDIDWPVQGGPTVGATAVAGDIDWPVPHPGGSALSIAPDGTGRP